MITAQGVLVRIAYDGTDFSGWATQKGKRTVEDAMRGAIVAVDPRGGVPRGASRTDAGVHAEGQLVGFDARLPLPPRGWVLTLNQHLPDDIAVRSARSVPVGYNPRFTSRAKTYRYELLFDKVRDPIQRARAWRVGYDMDMDRLAREARTIIGTHDFAAFRTAADVRVETRRTIHDVRVEQAADGRTASITIVGSAFLHNMVRILIGTLVDVGRDQLPEGTVTRALAARDRALAGPTAPAHGLFLESIDAELPETAGAPWPQ